MRIVKSLKRFNNAPVGVILSCIVYYFIDTKSLILTASSDTSEITEKIIKDEIFTSSIKISVNEDSFEVGIRRDDEFYFPWSWIEPYFDVYGKYNREKDIFEFSNANSKISYIGNSTYVPTSGFLNFGQYNVENRDRVKVVDGTYGVPISTQWSVEGYFYPIQISQYALVAYTKNMSSPAPQKIQSYLDKMYTRNCKWARDILKFEKNAGHVCTININESKLFKLQITGQFSIGTSISLLLETKDSTSGRTRKLKLTYIANQVPEKTDRINFNKDTNTVYIGLGRRDTMRSTFTRDLSNDVIKGIGVRETKSVRRHMIRLRKIEKIEIEGAGEIFQLTLSNSRYETNFYDAANWLFENQNKEGKWIIDVEKELDSYPTLQPGWCSAMAQGQALSVMVRAALVTGEQRFWDAVCKGLEPFKLDTADGGVRNRFLDKYVWYEEYPFTDGLFVLNGFMYSLIGLYDVISAKNPPDCAKIEGRKLFNDGIESLKMLLPLFDNGKGSNYDLQHFVKKKAPNRARWDYHTVHIQQLNVFKSILQDDIFAQFSTRWLGYLKGHNSDHN